MQQERLITERPVTVGPFTLTVVSRIVIRWPQIAGVTSYYASKQPVYLLVSSTLGEQAFTPDGIEIPLQTLKSELTRYDLNQITS